MEIVVSGRNVEVPEHFRVHVAEKLARLERYDHKIVGMEVELFHERNRRQSKSCQRVEITGRGCGPVARAEACGPDFYAALDSAIGKLESRLRRAHDRRRVPYNGRTRKTVRAMNSTGSGMGTALLEEELSERTDRFAAVNIPAPRAAWEPDEQLPGQIVRDKEHPAKPMSVDEALAEMELVGHDFYLFACVDTGRPSVVYRRKGYDYGVIRLT
ncbi:ribosome hibernation-promoting factor, HPF/YfiA family [Pseudonocardia spinosispora]|uniref:ribosome hibernation-promoting factor, HPF/YfiA family n=1 Tax=Pseudonocardia spinosispora TaxID=103441 RepID=UPI00040B01BE|nr:ribosome-associated translation inhibitor RaiA [Pseudonocardia spinosispora]